MTLIKSVSGMRGTIGGAPGINLTPVDIVEMTSAYGQWLKSLHERPTVVVGRDGRRSGKHVQTLVAETLVALGIDIMDAGLSTTPSVEMYVLLENAQGGIIITASHNPGQWNALKFLNDKGEFISQDVGQMLITYSREKQFEYVQLDHMGTVTNTPDVIQRHVDAILELDLVDKTLVAAAGFHVVVDCINSTGAISIPILLDALGCTYSLLNSEDFGQFAHNPEPLEGHLSDLINKVREGNANLGIAVDPDVDRLAFVAENGNYLGEEYTLVAIAHYVLVELGGNTVSNMSSTKALHDLTDRHGYNYSAAPVGEVHVVNKMKETGAVIGGEGNGGIILPELHYGRDALVGIALLLTSMAKSGKSLSEIRAELPEYRMSKSKVQLEGLDPDQVLATLEAQFPGHHIDRRDGVKVHFDDGWIHVRRSNTEPIMRIYAEAPTNSAAGARVELVKEIVGKM